MFNKRPFFKNILLRFYVSMLFMIIFAITLSGCNEQFQFVKEKLSGNDSDVKQPTAVVAQRATPDKDQWEYLVVTFGKTSFINIEESIKVGSSKLVAFQEFVTLLNGHEGIDLQSKLDLLGRFGWELVDSIGAIGGDQELLLKRRRLANRIEIEQGILKKLSVILKEESAKREAQVQALLRQMEKYQEEQVAGMNDELVEMDAKDQAKRERSAQIEAKSKIQARFREPGNTYTPKTLISDVLTVVFADENNSKQMDYHGKVTLKIDATEALLFDGNRYRKSAAQSIANKILRLAMQESGTTRGVSGGFTLDIQVIIKYNDEDKVVANKIDFVRIPGYKGFMERF